MIAVIYRWRVRAGMEQDFIAAWARATETLKPLGGYGSALFKQDDGLYCAIARWPDAEARLTAFAQVDDASILDAMAACVEERFAPIVMEELCNLWLPTPPQ